MTHKGLGQEWRVLRKDRTTGLAMSLFMLLLSYGLWNGWSWSTFQKSALAAAHTEETQRLTRLQREMQAIQAGALRPTMLQDPTNPGVAGSQLATRYAVLPPAPTAALSIGQSDLAPYYFRVSTRSRATFTEQGEIENPTHLLAGHFDLSFVIVFLYPLLALALSYNLLSLEKEQGTLALAMAQPIRLSAWVGRKLMVRAAMLLLPTLMLSLFAAIFGTVPLTQGGAWRLLLWAVLVAVYGLFWSLLALLVNTFNRSSATNALALAGLWLWFVVLLPAVLHAAISALHPVPSRVELIQAMRDASTDANQRASLLLARYYEDHPDLLPQDAQINTTDFMARSFAMQQEVERAVQPVLDYHDLQLTRQQKLVDRYQYLSPAIVMQTALHDVSGNGQERRQHFMQQVEQFHQAWQSYFLPRVFQQTSLTAEDINNLPAFTYQEEPDRTVAKRLLVAIASLGTFVLLTGLGSWLGLRRYQVAG